MDGFGDLIAHLKKKPQETLDVEKSSCDNTSVVGPSSDNTGPSTAPSSSSSSTAATAAAEASREAHVRKVEVRLKTFMCDLADPGVRDQINKQLAAIHYSKFIDYYLGRKSTDLSSYSIEKELDRMKFTVTCDGSTVNNVDAIVSIYQQYPDSAVWKLANQSIYADILLALQQHFVRPELCVAVVATTSSFFLDLGAQTVRAVSTFLIVTVKDREGKERLEIGTTESTVDVNLLSETVSQSIETPHMCMVFDDDLRRAAEAIAEMAGDEDDEENNSRSIFRTLQTQVRGLNIKALGTSLLHNVNNLAMTKGGNPSSPSSSAATAVTNPLDQIAESMVLSFGRMLHVDRDAHSKKEDDDEVGGFQSLLAGLKRDKDKDKDKGNPTVGGSSHPEIDLGEKSNTTIKTDHNENHPDDGWEDW